MKNTEVLNLFQNLYEADWEGFQCSDDDTWRGVRCAKIGLVITFNFTCQEGYVRIMTRPRSIRELETVIHNLFPVKTYEQSKAPRPFWALAWFQGTVNLTNLGPLISLLVREFKKE